MRDEGNIFTYLLVAFMIVATLVGPLLQRWWRRRLQERGEQVEGPEPAEPKLPYEDIVDQVFGPYMNRRRAAYEARRAAAAADEEEAEEEAPPPPAPEPVIRRIQAVEEPPARPPALPAAASPSESDPAAERPRLTLEDRLFANARLSAGAKLVLAAEILHPPRSLRGRGRERR